MNQKFFEKCSNENENQFSFGIQCKKEPNGKNSISMKKKLTDSSSENDDEKVSLSEMKKLKTSDPNENNDENNLWVRTLQIQKEFVEKNCKKFLQPLNCFDFICDIESTNENNETTESEQNSQENQTNEFNYQDDDSISSKSCESKETKSLRIKKKIVNIKTKYDLNFCRDCLNEASSNELCRFVGWRMLKKENDTVVDAGFLDLNSANEEDYSIWQINNKLSVRSAELKNYYLKYISTIQEKCIELLEYEIKIRETFAIYKHGWKRLIMHTRELCDKCYTTIFNGHFVCKKCGYAVCLNCYETRINNEKKGIKIKRKKTELKTIKKDDYNWHHCSKYEIIKNEIKEKRKNVPKLHEPEKMIYVQFIPFHILQKILTKLKHEKFIQTKTNTLTENIISYQSSKSQECWLGNDPKFLVLNGFEKEKSKQEMEEILFEKFDEEWQNQRPILIKNIHKNLSSTLWTPKSFSEEFGELCVDLINCRNQRVVSGIPMSKFWLGFEDLNARFYDKKDRPLILKLKDWPTTDDFKLVLPSRYEDLMNNLPLFIYTRRDGFLNLASSLPEFFLRPDLGPKLYIAYSSADTPKEGTTNLHCDISDAVNLLIYVGQTSSSSSLKSTEKYYIQKSIKESNCDQAQIDRHLKNGELPGAIWHIFRPQDADKIRNFLVTCNMQKGRSPKINSDPIHDQTNYIDKKMLEKLEKDYEVKPFSIIQYLGDAIFLPAGAPHQVRNLSSCIKVAGDFVSPQGVENCLLITEQFRNLSEKHANHEDKLQIKNILYHRMKETLSIYYKK